MDDLNFIDNGVKDSSPKSVELFENPEFGKVRVRLIDGEPWFVGKDIASILGYSRPNDAVSDHVDEEDKMILKLSDIQDSLPDHMKGSKIMLINKDGLVSLIQKSEKASRETKRKLIERFGLEDKFYAIERKEINFKDDLESFFAAMCMEVVSQLHIGGYYLDFYVPALHLVIEYDEHDHVSYDHEEERIREAFIRGVAGFDLVRVNDRHSNAYNLGLISNHLNSNGKNG